MAQNFDSLRTSRETRVDSFLFRTSSTREALFAALRIFLLLLWIEKRIEDDILVKRLEDIQGPRISPRFYPLTSPPFRFTLSPLLSLSHTIDEHGSISGMLDNQILPRNVSPKSENPRINWSSVAGIGLVCERHDVSSFGLWCDVTVFRRY